MRRESIKGLMLAVLAVHLIACGQAPTGAEAFGGKHERATANGVQLHYVTAGEGDSAVVLLHGWPETWYEWRKIAPQLAGAHRVIIPDLRGLGDSSRPASGYDKNTLAQDVHELVRSLGIQQVALVGHDWGGVVAYRYAAMYPSEVTKLAVIDVGQPDKSFLSFPLLVRNGFSPWHFAFHNVPGLPEALLDGKTDVYLRWFFQGLAAHPEAISQDDVAEYVRAYSEPGAMHAGLEYYRAVFTDIDEHEQLAANKLPMPVLAVGGGASFGPMVEYSMRQVATNVQGAVIPDSGHWVPEEKPEELGALLSDFLK